MSDKVEIQVLVVEDNDLLRDGLEQFLDLCEGISVVGTAANGQEAISSCERLQPRVVLMDIGMPVMDGVTATRLIREQYPHIQVVILTNSYQDGGKQAALDAGACEYLQKGVTVEGIADAIRDAAQSNRSA